MYIYRSRSILYKYMYIYAPYKLFSGESGLGKSTLINSMFLADIYSNDYPGPSHRVKKTVQVETTRVLLRENGVNLTLTVVDTPGFGDAVDNSNCWQPVIDYVESKYEEFLNAESRVGRKPGWGGGGVDGRVHCCLYFVSPSGHGLKPLDAEFMRRLHDRVNVVPVVAKADTLTPEECAHFKKQIISEIAQHKIKIYEFPSGGDPGDDDEADVKRLRDRVPFAVVGSNAVVELEGGRKVRGRRYPWGIAEEKNESANSTQSTFYAIHNEISGVENLEHCDFVALRDMLIRTHLQDLKDVTNNVHYENYRCRKLAGLGTDGKPSRVSNSIDPTHEKFIGKNARNWDLVILIVFNLCMAFVMVRPLVDLDDKFSLGGFCSVSASPLSFAFGFQCPPD
ncbi:hypothetical protein J437_LFUL002740 [Ladona fulva]|uniref:Septin-type G domain-containing protein n=1 Tax=Ladona fulva TaxID=123851 RepID=A0A8K0K1U4_LADFU|nr:hypothetical protein J437_LFUL002740 [Ladona fulva]